MYVYVTIDEARVDTRTGINARCNPGGTSDFSLASSWNKAVCHCVLRCESELNIKPSISVLISIKQLSLVC